GQAARRPRSSSDGANDPHLTNHSPYQLGGDRVGLDELAGLQLMNGPPCDRGRLTLRESDTHQGYGRRSMPLPWMLRVWLTVGAPRSISSIRSPPIVLIVRNVLGACALSVPDQFSVRSARSARCHPIARRLPSCPHCAGVVSAGGGTRTPDTRIMIASRLLEIGSAKRI